MRSKALIISIVTVAITATALLHSIEAVTAESQSAGSVDSGKKARADNRALSRAVRKSLTHAKGLDSSRINVVARGGSVTLAGSAPDQDQIESAGNAAAKVAGVSRVDNRLTVREAGR